MRRRRIRRAAMMVRVSRILVGGSQGGREQNRNQHHEKGRQKAQCRHAQFETLLGHALQCSKIDAAAPKTCFVG